MLAQLSQSRPLFTTVLIGIMLLPLLYLINSYSPPAEKAPGDYNSVILAFEFVSDDTELKEVLGPLTLDEINNLDRLNKVDFAFMIMYGIFLISIILKLKKLHNHPWLLYIAILTVVAVGADVAENLQLLNLTNAHINSADTTMGTINLLAIFTWTKWILLSVVIGAIGYSLIIANRYMWVGYVLFIPLVLGASAISMKTPLIEDTFGTSVFLCFTVLWLLSIFYRSTKTA